MRTFFTALISVIILSFASCTQNNFREFSGLTWGTTFHIVYNSPIDLNDSILAQLEKVDMSLSMFNPLSTITAINSSLAMRPDKYIADVLKISRKANRLSFGAFDPTIEPLVNLWGFGPEAYESGAIPSDSSIDVALSRVGIANCYITADGILKRTHPLTRFDFSGVAKGYGVQKVAAMLERNGCKDFKVEIGGEIVLQGLNPSGKPWKIRIEAPNPDPSHSEELCIRAFGPEPTSIASSGNYRNFRTDSLGRRYGHTISPRTGRPIQSDVLGATVILPGPDCGLADALATASMVLNSDSAAMMLRNAGASAILVVGVDAKNRRTIEVHPDSAALSAQK